MPTSTKKRTPSPASSIITTVFHMQQLGRNRTIRIYLPRNYHKHTDRRFPVIYIQDGQNLFDPHTAAFRHWKLKDFMDRQPLYRQAILVGIDNGGHDRVNEYAPYKRGKHGGEGHAFLEFIAHTLKPVIDKTYRTWPEAAATGLVGSSLGGLLSLYGGLTFGNTFGKIGVLSPSLWFNPAVLNLKPTTLTTGTRFYICGSRTESSTMAPLLEKAYWNLKATGMTDEQLRVVIRDRGRHSETFWAREFRSMYEWLFPRTVL